MAEHTSGRRDVSRSKAEGSRSLSVGGVLTVAASLLGSVVGYAVVPAQMRVHYTLGLGPYYGPELLPRAVVLVAFPALVVALAVGARLLAGRLRGTPEFDEARVVYDVTVLATLAVVVLVQAVLIGLNL